MCILITGQLSVRTQEGKQVALIDPIAPVGVNGHLHRRTSLVSLMRRNPSMEIVISRNLIATLSDRLRHANGEITHLQKLIADIGEGQTLPPDPAE